MTELRIKKLSQYSVAELQKIADASYGYRDAASRMFKSSSMSPLVSERMKTLGVDVSILEQRAQDRMLESRIKNRETKFRKDLKNFEQNILPFLFIKDSPFDGKKARRMISGWNHYFGWFEYKCSLCPVVDEYNGRPITLQIDHINGDSRDHRLENLRYVCPNCHSQTETFTGRNVAINKKRKAEMAALEGSEPSTSPSTVGSDLNRRHPRWRRGALTS